MRKTAGGGGGLGSASDDKIIALAPHTHKTYNNQPTMVTAVSGKWRGARGRLGG